MAGSGCLCQVLLDCDLLGEGGYSKDLKQGPMFPCSSFVSGDFLGMPLFCTVHGLISENYHFWPESLMSWLGVCSFGYLEWV